MYRIIRSILFRFDAEAVHHFSMNIFKAACSVQWIRKWLSKQFRPLKTKPIQFNGLTFSNPIGLAAGFDKNAMYLRELQTLGFGHIEIGTVTPLPQSGNEKPRLFRLPKDKALINRMGFNNSGVKKVAENLQVWRNNTASGKRNGALSSDTNTTSINFIIGGNIGKNKITPNEEAWKDYEICFTTLFDWVDYFVVNVSSPNTPGLRELQEKESLRKILSHLQSLNRQQQSPKPLLLKIAPDLSEPQINDVVELALEIKLDGLVISNTTIKRTHLQTGQKELDKIGAGGLSGKPLSQRSTEIIRYVHQQTNGQIPIIASGGVFTSSDLKEKLTAGASLVQVWTGFIYEGPGIVKKILFD